MCKTTNRLLLTVILLIFCNLSFTQNEINSPYSSFAIGNLSPRSNLVSGAMGGVGYALQTPYYINFKNPAAFASFDSLTFIADLGFSFVNNELKTRTQDQKGVYAQLDYIAIGMPITKHWRSSLGIMPYSDVGYAINDTRQVDSFGTVLNKYNGSGGVQMLYWGNAFKLYKGLSLGVNLSYLFGSVNTLSFAEYSIPNTFNTLIADIRYIDGIYVSAGLQYQTQIKEKHHIGIGVVYENSIHVWSRENLIVLNYLSTYTAGLKFDTVSVKTNKNAIKSAIKLPQTIGLGLTYGYKDKLIVSTDITYHNWKQFSMSQITDTLRDAITTNLGFQFVPNALSSKYANKINFRLGTRFSSGFRVLNKQPINEFAISFGLGFPFRAFNGRSSINVMFEYSKLGTLKSDLIQQNYYRLAFNFILHERWYQRRKLD